MRGTVFAAIAASFVALVFVGKPASATPATAALAYGENHAGVVEQVGRRERYVRKWRRAPYYGGYYAYRPYYWGRPYAYYGYPYYYRRGPGVSLWFGF